MGNQLSEKTNKSLASSKMDEMAADPTKNQAAAPQKAAQEIVLLVSWKSFTIRIRKPEEKKKGKKRKKCPFQFPNGHHHRTAAAAAPPSQIRHGGGRRSQGEG
jgi:hypothetical protein